MKKFFIFYAIFLCLLTNLLAEQPPIYARAQSENTIKAIIFDFGGVVVEVDRQMVIDFLAKYFDLSHREAASAMHQLRIATDAGESEEAFWNKFAQSKGKKLTSDWQVLWDNAKSNAFKEIPGVLSIVENLKNQGYIVGLFSNVTQFNADIIRKKGYYKFFHPLLLSYEIGFEKPDPKAYETLLSSLNLPANEVLFIDHKAENVFAAKAMGIDAIFFISPSQLLQELDKRGIKVAIKQEKPNKVFSILFPNKEKNK